MQGDSFGRWLTNLLKSGGHGRAGTASHARQFPMRVEPLEDRTLLSPYNFVRIDDSADFFDFPRQPTMNNAGLVAFLAGGDSLRKSSVMTGDGSTPVRVVEALDNSDFISTRPVINDAEQIAFVSGRGEDLGVGLNLATTYPQSLFSHDDGPFFDFSVGVDIKNSGSGDDSPAVAFLGRRQADNGGVGIYLANDDSTGTARFDTIFETHDTLQPVPCAAPPPIVGSALRFGNPSVNTRGTVAFYFGGAIYTGSAGDPELTRMAGDLSQIGHIYIGDVQVDEGYDRRNQAILTVHMSGLPWDVHEPITVHYETVPGTAVEGTDYDAVSGELTFDPPPCGQTYSDQTIRVPIIGDTVAQGNRFFRVELSGVNGEPLPYAVPDNGRGGMVEIVDDDDIAALSRVYFCGRRPVVVEGERGTVAASFDVCMNGITANEVAVNFGTFNGSAKGGEDYVPTTGSFVFPANPTPGVLTQTILVSAKGDERMESVLLGLDGLGETFGLALDASDGVIRYPYRIATILDDDSAVVPRQRPAINDAGNLAFVGATVVGQLDSTSDETDDFQTLYFSDGGIPTPIVDTKSAFGAFGDGLSAYLPSHDAGLRTVAINTDDQVAFFATLDDYLCGPGSCEPKQGIFAGTHTELGFEIKNVVITGDIIDGATVTHVYPSVDLNDSGQIVFWVTLNRTSNAIYRADPGDLDCSGPIVDVFPKASGGGWTMDVAISDDDGIVLSNVKLGDRYMAESFSVPYLTLQTSAMTEPERLELKRCSLETPGRSRLVSASTTESEQEVVIEAVYDIDKLTDESTSRLRVTQRYEFHEIVDPTMDRSLECEPSGQPCARFYPIVKYEFVGQNGETIQQIQALQRLHFQVSESPMNAAGIFKDCDRLRGCRHFQFENEMNPVDRELSGTAINHGGPADWDNVHQTFKDKVGEPFTTFIPGCPECVHVHWRWSKVATAPVIGDPAFKNNGGQPFLSLESQLAPADKKQSADFAVVRSDRGDDDQVFDIGTHGASMDGASPAFWYRGTGFLNSDQFFTHGGFFMPLTDLALQVNVPDRVPVRAQLIYTVTVTNLGPKPEDAALFDTLPKGVKLESVSVAVGWCLVVRRQIQCGLPGLAVGQAIRITIVVSPRKKGIVTNEAEVLGVLDDPVPSNNKAVVSTVVEKPTLARYGFRFRRFT